MVLTTISAVVFLVVFLADLFGLHTNPYLGIVFFVVRAGAVHRRAPADSAWGLDRAPPARRRQSALGRAVAARGPERRAPAPDYRHRVRVDDGEHRDRVAGGVRRRRIHGLGGVLHAGLPPDEAAAPRAPSGAARAAPAAWTATSRRARRASSRPRLAGTRQLVSVAFGTLSPSDHRRAGRTACRPPRPASGVTSPAAITARSCAALSSSAMTRRTPGR